MIGTVSDSSGIRYSLEADAMLSTNGPYRAITPLLSEGQGKTRPIMADALLLMLAIEVVNHPIHQIAANRKRQQEEQIVLFRYCKGGL